MELKKLVNTPPFLGAHAQTPLPPTRKPHSAPAPSDTSTPRDFRDRVAERGADDAHLDAALNPAVLVREGALYLNTLLQEGGGAEAEEAAAAAAALPLAAPSPADVDVAWRVVARCVVARWRVFEGEVVHYEQAV